MKKGKLYVERNFKVAQTDPRLFGAFLEHLGRAIYTGIYEPGHPTADSMGFRRDVLALVEELGCSCVRYPGGNFLSGYEWTDGIGPRESRPKRLDYAWFTIESNQVGIDEFVDWSKKAKTDVMAAVNMGTGTIQSAGNMVEYCNFEKGTYWSDLRRKNGHKDPHNIKLWCVGNEMDGPWQTGQLDADDYGKKAKQACKIMKWVDPSIELVICGSSNSSMPTYPSYDRIVLEHTYEHADYLSLHMYFHENQGQAGFLSSFLTMNDFIHTVASAADYVKALKRSKKTLHLSFDEWNVWYNDPVRTQAFSKTDPVMGQNPAKLGNYFDGPPHILENNYSMLDTLAFGGLMMSLVNNADRVKIACLAQLVNAIAPIVTKENGPVIRQGTFYPFKDMSMYGRGTVLQAVTDIPTLETPNGDAPAVYTCIVNNEEKSECTVFALNIDQEDMMLSLDMRSLGEVEMIEHRLLKNEDLSATNTFADPDCISPTQGAVLPGKNSSPEVKIPALSWNVLRFRYA
ncbi:MAG: alpha-N-arabinofuranosidase [Oscillospiraceae bacterium]|nr:alpha-N-arabinofuranosidase [Oscillospiraceae bacterium]